VHTYGHYPFGETWYETGTADKWKFTTYERDSESNLDYAMFRYDSSRLGRFMTPDPIAGSMLDPQSLNRYAYVLNDPTDLVDPLGLCPFCGGFFSRAPLLNTGDFDWSGAAWGILVCIRDGIHCDEYGCHASFWTCFFNPEGRHPGTPERQNPLEEECIITSSFEDHQKRDPPSNLPGIDLRTAKGHGTEVFSPVSGTVDPNRTRSGGTPGGRANQVAVRENSTGILVYLVHVTPNKNIPSSVTAGDRVAVTDDTGVQTAEHLHVAARDRHGNLIDPVKARVVSNCKPK
jgi:RHS repeat-associated protein